MAVKHDFKRILGRYKQLKTRLPKIIGNTAISFAKNNFRRRGFMDKPNNVKKWQKRQPNAPRDKGRAILVDTGTMKRSIRVTRTTPTTVHIGSSVEYAQIHNEGGTIKRKVNVRGHKRRTRSGGLTDVKAHERNVNTTIPQRQFIGASDELNRRFEEKWQKEFEKIYKK